MSMKFQKSTRRRAVEYEPDLVKYWNENKIFEKSVDQRPADNVYVFYDGPPFITGVPHHGTLLTSVVKDAVPRYWAMKGKRVERTWGWDCHGLPAEVFTEKKLGIHDRRDIGTKISLEEYILTCRDNMVQTGNEWETTIDRIGRWVNFKGAYKTMDKDYMESVWWAFKKLYDEQKIYEGEKVLLYCVRDATPISKSEVAMDNSYQDVTDPSVYVKFKIKTDKDDTFVLAWTTTPWTLPANTAVAVNEKEEYAEVTIEGSGGEKLILAKALLNKVLTDEKHNKLNYVVIRTLLGSELIGMEYTPLFENSEQATRKNVYKIWHADYVTLDEGTGIVHLAPAYGEEDYALSKEKGFPFVNNIDDSGFYESGEWKGQYVWDANKPIAKQLLEQGKVWKIEYITHSYPHCHRCGTKLMYRAHPSWFMDIEGQRSLMLEQNDEVNWFPEHVKHGRSQKTIETAPDWNLSRDRFWATAMPVWRGKDVDGHIVTKVVGSYVELKELSGRELDDYHRPWVDDITFEIDGVTYTRIDKVMDCWFESGSMPFAQFHYPFENKEKFEANFPGDFIVEYVGQVRAWFYYMNAVNVGLFGHIPFKNALVHGTIAGNDGRKMSKSFGNYTDPNELMDRYSADSLRFLFLSSPLLNGEDYAMQDKDVADVARKLSMIWNMYDFFTLYADVDAYEWDGNLQDPSPELTNVLDKWVVSRLHQLNNEVDTYMAAYDIPHAVKPILEFIDDASNWYVRRSRKRFWKSDNDVDKTTAYKTLHYILVQLSMIMAPFTPFLSEELYRKLTGGESVHLLDWPAAGEIDTTLLASMAFTRQAITDGLAQRASGGVKVRQPLQSVSIYDDHDHLSEELQVIITEELNVKQVEVRKNPDFSPETSFTERTDSSVSYKPDVVIDLTITPELKREGMMREVVRNVQNARKEAGLDVDDRIDLVLETDDAELGQALSEHGPAIQAETLASSLARDRTDAAEGGEGVHVSAVVIDGANLSIQLIKVS
jgi:isoleucyl-tRNA synthetase